jgi:hypothetical protein
MKKLIAVALAFSAMSPAGAATLFNGNYYEFVAGPLDFNSALAAAAAATPMTGYQAHLATVTSQAENDFLYSLVPGGQRIWLAGSDAAVEGTWKWVAGPESGQTFWVGDGAGTAFGYANWNKTAEPNNSSDEDHLSAFFFGTDKWNDWQGGYPTGYVVEYSALAAVPEPATWAMMLFGFGAVGYSMRSRKTSFGAVQAA